MVLDSSQSKPTERIDVITVAAIAIVVYLISTIAHEALGHGLAAILMGFPIKHVSSVDLDIVYAGATNWPLRFVSAAGCIANLIVALFASLLGYVMRHKRVGTTRYFLWLLVTNNLLIPGGYMMVLTFAGFGDWNGFIDGLPNPLLWQAGITLLGVAISFLGLFIGVRNLDIFVGRAESGPNRRGKRGVTLTFVSYIAGGTASTLASIFNPVSPLLILISAGAASFGGTAFLMWMNSFIGKARPSTPEEILTPSRNWVWIALGILSLIIYFAVLGPGLPR